MKCYRKVTLLEQNFILRFSHSLKSKIRFPEKFRIYKLEFDWINDFSIWINFQELIPESSVLIEPFFPEKKFERKILIPIMIQQEIILSIFNTLFKPSFLHSQIFGTLKCLIQS